MAQANTVLIGGIIAAIGMAAFIPIYLIFQPPNAPLLPLLLDLQNKKIVVDGLGRPVEIPKNPKRIVSLAPSNTEILHNISCEKSRVVGKSFYCNYPPEWSDIMVIGDFIGPDIDLIFSVFPDLVLGRNVQQQIDLIPQLEAANIPIFIMPIEDTVEDIFSNMNLMGYLINKETNASQMVTKLENALEKITNSVNGTGNSTLLPIRVKTYYEIWNDPVYIAGGGTFIGDALYKAGGINLGSFFAGSWPSLDLPALELAALNPEHIVIPNWYNWNDIDSRTGWSSVPAVVNDNYTAINSDLIERPGPRIVDAIYILAKNMVPNLFPWL